MNPLGSLPSGRTDSWDPLSWVSKDFSPVRQVGPPGGVTVELGERVHRAKVEMLGGGTDTWQEP